jgi:transposase-like protein
MGQVRHGSATTTHAVRAAIQRSQASLAQLSRELGINPKTVAKSRKRAKVEDLKTGPKEPRSTILTEAEEATIVAFRRHTLLPLDDCLYALQPSIPHLARSALHRCLQRHGISRLPDVADDKPKRQQFNRYPIGFFHIDIAEVQTVEGNLYLFVGIDRTSKFAVTQLMDKADRKTAREFLEHLLKTVPYRIHKILTDNGHQNGLGLCNNRIGHSRSPLRCGLLQNHFRDLSPGYDHLLRNLKAAQAVIASQSATFRRCYGIQFADPPRNRNTASSRQMRLDMMCEPNGIKHRLTKPNHPWTNGQVERMNRTIKDATIKRFHYDSHDQLRTRLADFLAADNFARGLKTLSDLTPYEYIRKIWISEPSSFILNPIHQMPGLNTLCV